jgi:fumarate reductase subunit D
MKKIFIVVFVLLLLFGCATKYTIPPERVNYHAYDREQCRLENPRGGTFLIGPIIIILPLFIALVAASHAIQATKIDNCMAAKGYPVPEDKNEQTAKN